MASGRLSPGLSRNRLPPLIIKTKHKHKYPSKIDGTATYSKYYKILDNCVNHSYAKKCKAKGKNKWKMKMKSKVKKKNERFFLFFFLLIEEECFQLTAKGSDTRCNFEFFFLISKLRELKNLVPGELMEIFLWATKEARHLCLVSGREGPGVDFMARLIITFASQARVI